MQSMFTLFRAARPTLEWVESRTPRRFGLPRVLSAVQSMLAVLEPSRVPVPVAITRRPYLGALALGLMAVLAAGAPQTSLAQVQSKNWQSSQFQTVADGQLVDVQVLVQDQTVPLYVSPRAWDRHYFQAFEGRNYAIAIKNNSGRRVGVLVSVDGLNVVNGERSHLSSREPMYVLDPYERSVIKGWRTSLQNVRKFVFVDEERSYAERTGQANGDMGWIRVMAFRENAPLAWDWGKVRSGYRDNGAQAPSAPYSGDDRNQAAPQEESFRKGEAPEASRDYAGGQPSNPGTGWGTPSRDPVRQVRFVAESHATDQLILRYEYASGLRALGIEPLRFRDRTWERERGQLGFAKPPKW